MLTLPAAHSLDTLHQALYDQVLGRLARRSGDQSRRGLLARVTLAEVSLGLGQAPNALAEDTLL